MISSFLITQVEYTNVYAVEFFLDGSSPFGVPYKDWVDKWWNWWISVHKDNVTNAQLEKKDCLANLEGPVVFLMNPSFAGGEKREKVCEISDKQGILFNFLTAECDTGLSEQTDSSYRELINCALEDDQGTLHKEAYLDNVKIPENKIEEIYTNEFNISISSNNVYDAEPGSFKAAAHGWYVFVKPLSSGNHVLTYKSALFGVPYGFTSDITYHFKVTK
jgi:hypothetical protein